LLTFGIASPVITTLKSITSEQSGARPAELHLQDPALRMILQVTTINMNPHFRSQTFNEKTHTIPENGYIDLYEVFNPVEHSLASNDAPGVHVPKSGGTC
jgi:hypothetical protein